MAGYSAGKQTLTHFLLLQFHRPGDVWPLPLAVLLYNPSTDQLHVRGRVSYASVADPEDELVLTETIIQLQVDAGAGSGAAILELLEQTLSNSVLLT